MFWRVAAMYAVTTAWDRPRYHKFLGGCDQEFPPSSAAISLKASRMPCLTECPCQNLATQATSDEVASSIDNLCAGRDAHRFLRSVGHSSYPLLR
jgi:hypothetical protein